MSTEIDVYRDLELALNEFFNPLTPNKRKQEIEQMLQMFQKNPVSITYSLSFIEHSENQYVLMYSCHVLQTAVDTSWLHIDQNVKKLCRERILRKLPEYCRSHPQFLCKKLIKIYADIIRFEPSLMGNYFNDIFQVLANDSSRNLGLLQLQISLEEFFAAIQPPLTSVNILSSDQKERVNFGLKTKLEDIFAVLIKLASTVVAIYSSTINLDKPCAGFFEFCKHFCTHSDARFCLPHEYAVNCCGILHCTTIIYQHIDLSFFGKTFDLLNFVTGLSLFGCKYPLDADDCPEIIAFNCLIELISRTFPAAFDFDNLKFFDVLYFCGEQLISMETTKLQSLNETWLQKYVELNRLLFAHHFHRYDGNEKYPTFNLVRNFLILTDHSINAAMFLQCIDAWNVFLDYLNVKTSSKSDEDRLISSRYEPLFEIAVNVLVNKIHVWNNVLVHDLDTKFDDSFESSEWGTYLLLCCDTLAKIGDFQPNVVFQALKSSFETKSVTYFDLTDLEKCATINASELVNFFKDFQSILKALGHLAHLFINESFWKYNDEVKDFIEKFAQFLLCVRSYCHWVAQFYADAQRSGENNEIVSSIISSNVDCIAPVLLDTSSPLVLVKASTATLYSILITVRPHQYFLSMNNVRLLYEEASTLKFFHYPPEIYKVLYGSLINYLILPWYNAVECEQEWSTRKPMYQKLMKILLNDYMTLCNVHSKNSVDLAASKKCVFLIVPILVELLDSISNEFPTTKKFCYSVFKPVAHGTLHLLDIFDDQPDILEQLLSLLSSLFNALIIQLGGDFAKDAVGRLLRTTQSENLLELLKIEASSTCKFLELVLKISHSIVKEMSKSFQQFTESVLALTLQNIRPILNQISSVDLKMSFYEVLYSTLVVRWRYFFPVSILASMENHSLGDKTEHLEQLLLLLQAFGESLMNPEPSIVKQNLTYVNSANSKWNLYKKAVFIKNLYPDFVRAFMTLLINRQQPILVEDFCETLANMVCSCDESFNLFENDLLKQFLTSLGDLNGEQMNCVVSKLRVDKEVPSFCINVQKFCNDIAVLRLSNVH